jgi:hypothetical protein
MLYFKDDVHSCAYGRTLFTFWTAIFVKYDILAEYLTLFWFAMLVNEYKLYVSNQKSSKDAKFGQCLYLGVPLCYEQNWCAEPGVEIIFNWKNALRILIMLLGINIKLI